MKSEPLMLPRNCGNCRFFDGDAFCALPPGIAKPAGGFIRFAQRVVCAEHQPVDADDVEGAAV